MAAFVVVVFLVVVVFAVVAFVVKFVVMQRVSEGQGRCKKRGGQSENRVGCARETGQYTARPVNFVRTTQV
ncbi:hypothetical protein LZ32DRAFT_603889, partial [Colletotrichum eremochloae]